MELSPCRAAARPRYTAGVITDAELSEALRRYWGYAAFRPLQGKVVRSLLEGHDACVVMPTGGGKSLCYQLPAALSGEKTAIVVSPLIALMQDQIAQLAQMGIPAALLNSSLAHQQQSRIMRRACEGAYRLLYLSPERIARADTPAWLAQVPVSFFAIDEAHCISEWGPEFRPDYRQLSALRLNFPDRPLAAFTASATRTVRHDIIEQLRMRDPHKYIASFHRPNLRYVVRLCENREQQGLLVSALRHHAGSNVIVYAPTIARVEETVAHLAEQGIAALPYHGRMDAGTRRENQERWMADEVPVLVGTLAFGLGINKAAVRAVIHLALPKSIEQYYQEAGRAGRDGLPADCLLLWQQRDAALLAHFIKELSDPAETSRAWQRYRDMRNFAEGQSCRHRRICTHFGETTKWQSCAACDICTGEPEWLSQASDSEPPRRANRPVRRTAGPVVATGAAETHAATPSSVRVTAARTTAAPATPLTGSPAQGVNPELREYLRQWRREAATRQGVPAFIVMYDSTLEEVCRVLPRSLREIRSISGFGERKTETYGQLILDALQRFRNGERARKEEPKLRSSGRKRALPAVPFSV
jgi:ATP-dependent DNA helicase RecQ